MLKSMKGVKMLGLSRRMQSLVHDLRSAEISAAFQFRALMSSVIVIGTKKSLREHFVMRC